MPSNSIWSPMRDGQLIARHDNELSITTDIAEHDEFKTRRCTKHAAGLTFEGWFSEDFTRDEIRSLRARERMPFRSHDFDGQFAIPDLSEVLRKFAIRGRWVDCPPSFSN